MRNCFTLSLPSTPPRFAFKKPAILRECLLQLHVQDIVIYEIHFLQLLFQVGPIVIEFGFARCATATIQAPLAELATHCPRLVLAFITFCFSALRGLRVVLVMVVKASHLPLHFN
jgi:hypothetical protein